MIKRMLLSAALCITCAMTYAQDAPKLYGDASANPEYVYTDAAKFPVYGKCIEETSTRYTRLPEYLHGAFREDLWDLGTNSAGLYIRFRTNSRSIRLKWASTKNFRMNHMTAAGISGLDLYALDGSKWREVCGVQPRSNDISDVKVIGNMDGQMREYMLYLSLYDGIKSLEIGTEQGSVIEGPKVQSPRTDKPIVMYGTSILQGGCANRTGMAFTAILGRNLDREVINLGFSGNARLDPEIAELMIKVKDPGVFVLDNIPNCTLDMIHEREEKFFHILRDAHPDVPIIFVENPTFTDLWLDIKSRGEIAAKNAAHRAIYERLKKEGQKNIYYVYGDKLNGTDGEGAVDGCHFTDLGMIRYAAVLQPVIEKALKKRK